MEKNKTSRSIRSPRSTPIATFNKTRGAAMRAQRRVQDDAQKALDQFAVVLDKPLHSSPDNNLGLSITFLGGLEEVGEKNMAVLEYKDEALIIDCGNNLGIKLPGINYSINDPTYLESIKHKIKAYVITHGHLDHVGGLRHIVPKYPAPIYGSAYTIGIIKKSFQDENTTVSQYIPELRTVSIDDHERLKVGRFFVEFIRVTHSLPDPAAIAIDTPVGRIIATGDFRLDPEPLDNRHTDIARLKQLGDEGVLLLMSDSTYADSPGRTPTEHTLQKSFVDVIEAAKGRIFVAVFSSNINRIQMIINAASSSGRKVAFDGRSMIAYVEIAVRNGILKVPKGTVIPLQSASSYDDDQILVMCTGGQGEPNAALQRMSEGTHKFLNLEKGDTVVISSTPIPGNDISYEQISNRLQRKGVFLFRHPTHELDGCGPLHVSGHARRDELSEMIRLTRPDFFIPVHGGSLRRYYHAQLGIKDGMDEKHILLPQNGDKIIFKDNTASILETVPHGNLFVDQNGSVVSGIVIKDRLMLAKEGIVSIILTIDGRTGKLTKTPDIITRGFIVIREQTDFMNLLRNDLRSAVEKQFSKSDAEHFKAQLREHVLHFVYEHTEGSPIVITVVNVVGGMSSVRPTLKYREHAE